MNNYERVWFKKWFSNVSRLKAFRKSFSKSESSYVTGSHGTEWFNYNYPPNSTCKDKQHIRITKHKIDQYIEETFREN